VANINHTSKSTLLVADCEQTPPVWQTGGDGTPGSWMSPAEAESASAHTKTQQDTKRLIVDSPVFEVGTLGQAGFASRTRQYTVKTSDDLALFRTLADRSDFDSLTTLCRERLLTARDSLTSLRWTKDHAIVRALQSDYTGAYDLLAGVHYFASQTEGAPRGKYEDEFGIALSRLGRTSLALGRFAHAYQEHRKAGHLRGCAIVDVNRARALMKRGEEAKATRYLKRALDYARGADDLRLTLEILETVKEFQLFDRIERKLA
jgi:hypothetical protein